MKPFRAAALACLLAAAAAAPVRAAPGCSITTAVGPLAFGPYDVFAAADVTSSMTLTYKCPPPLSPKMNVTGGNSSSVLPRYMTGPGTDHLKYKVCQDAACSTEWTAVYVSIPGGKGSLPIYGAIPAGQDVSVGTYGDSLTITILF